MTIGPSFRLVPVAVIVVLCVCGGTRTCLAADADANALPVHAWFAQHPALDPSLQRQVRDRTVTLLERISGQQVAWKPAGKSLQNILQDSGSTPLTADVCRAEQLDAVPQAMILTVTYKAGTYALTCAIFNREFNDVITAIPRRVVQREQVTSNLLNMAHWTWRPMGRLVAANNGVFRISFSARGASPRLARGTTLEVVRLYDGTRGQLRHRWLDDSLHVKQSQNGQTTATVAVPPYRPTNFFDHISRAHYHVRVVRLKKGLTTVRVVLQSTRQPRECCAVYLSENMPGPDDRFTGEPVGFTDDAGEFTIPANLSRMKYATVRLGHYDKTRAIYQNPLVFELPRQAPRNEMSRDYRRVLRFINDVNDMNKSLRTELQAESETDAIDKIYGTLQQAPDFAATRARLQDVLKRARQQEFVQMIAQVEAALTVIDKATANWKKTLDDADSRGRQVRTNSILARVGGMIRRFEWVAALDEVDRWVMSDPENDRAKFFQRRLKKGISPRTGAQAAARKNARKLLMVRTPAKFISNWASLADSLKVLIESNDGLFFKEVASSLDRALKLLTSEKKQIDRKVDNAGDGLSEDEINALKRRLQKLAPVFDELIQADVRARGVARDFLRYEP